MSANAITLQRRSSALDRVWSLLLLGCASVSVLTTLGIVVVLVVESADFFATVPLARFFLDTQWTPLFADAHFGIWPLVSGTLLTTLVALCVAIPCGIAAAIYLAEFASPAVRRTLKSLLEMLASVPTVAFGYFALMLVTPTLQAVVPGLQGFNALGAGLMMGVMILPIIASLSEDAIFAVPSSLREGAYALGAGRVATIFRVVLPAAASGVGAAVILGISRAVGETMIVAIAAGQQPRLTADPRNSVETMTAYMAKVSMGDIPAGTLEYRTIFAVGLSLFVMTLVLNLLANGLRQRALRGGRP